MDVSPGADNSEEERATAFWILDDELLNLLRRAQQGEAPDLLLLECYANSDDIADEIEDDDG